MLCAPKRPAIGNCRMLSYMFSSPGWDKEHTLLSEDADSSYTSVLAVCCPTRCCRMTYVVRPCWTYVVLVRSTGSVLEIICLLTQLRRFSGMICLLTQLRRWRFSEKETRPFRIVVVRSGKMLLTTRPYEHCVRALRLPRALEWFSTKVSVDNIEKL